MLDAYREHVAERAQKNIPPIAPSPEQVTELVKLLADPPAGEEVLGRVTDRAPPSRESRGCLCQSGFLSARRGGAAARSSTERMLFGC